MNGNNRFQVLDEDQGDEPEEMKDGNQKQNQQENIGNDEKHPQSPCGNNSNPNGSYNNNNLGNARLAEGWALCRAAQDLWHDALSPTPSMTRRETLLPQVIDHYHRAIACFVVAGVSGKQGVIQSYAHLGEAKMFLAQVKTTLKRYDEAFENCYRAAIYDMKHSLRMSMQVPRDAVKMVLQKAEYIKEWIEDKLKQYQQKHDRMMAERDDMKSRMRRDRESLNVEIHVLKSLLNRMRSCDDDLHCIANACNIVHN